jgi:SAM-dependent methyltransferase
VLWFNKIEERMGQPWTFTDTKQHIAAAEHAAGLGDRAGAVAALRMLSFDQFAFLLWALPAANLPNLSNILPSAPSLDAQKTWTGAHGHDLVAKSIPFMRAAIWHYTRLTRKPINGRNVLDYGCGYGRFLRLIEYFVDPPTLFGCDPWQSSLDLCKSCAVSGLLKLNDAVPRELPFPGTKFNLVYAFSVFTHLPPTVMRACLLAIRRSMAEESLLIITIRPAEYWQWVSHPELAIEHSKNGYAYLPHPSGNPNYGDISITMECLAEQATGWRIVGSDWNHDDPVQQIILLQPS